MLLFMLDFNKISNIIPSKVLDTTTTIIIGILINVISDIILFLLKKIKTVAVVGMLFKKI